MDSCSIQSLPYVYGATDADISVSCVIGGITAGKIAVFG